MGNKDKAKDGDAAPRPEIAVPTETIAETGKQQGTSC